MATQYFCPNETRRQRVLEDDTANLNGIDYLEVLDSDAPEESNRQRTLLVRCLRPVPQGLTKDNVLISGGVRVSPVRVVWASRSDDLPPSPSVDNPPTNKERDFLAALPNGDHVLVVRTDSDGDYSPYGLTLVLGPNDPDPPAGFDSQLREVEFSFKVECPSDFDCVEKSICPPETVPQPPIDYLAKDYASFRRLMLDRLAVTVPGWKERNPADLGIAVVELLAYAGDRLSYHQDAVATEGYLGTARMRPSIRRIARLLDYPMNDGCNARCWIHFNVDADVIPGSLQPPALAKRTPLMTRIPGQPTVLDPTRSDAWLAHSPEIFETVHDVRELRVSRNTIYFYTWADPRCCLPKGATRATLLGSESYLALSPGDVLIFQEMRGPQSGLAVDADPTHRHPVRLISVEPGRDLLTNKDVLEIAWDPEDALPFPLCLYDVEDKRPHDVNDQHGAVHPVSVALGNVCLADHGMTFAGEELLPAAPPDRGRYRPQLQRQGLTHHAPYEDALARAKPAADVMGKSPNRALPAVTLDPGGLPWKPQRDLLSSDRFSREFVVEMENDGSASLRFGRNAPDGGLLATYRVGNGRSGNVGAGAIAHVATHQVAITSASNPLAAQGGTEPEPMSDVRLYAPQAFRRQERAVTTEDYAEVAERHPEVQKAAATLRWTGSWYTMFVTVDRKGGRPVDDEFKDELRLWLERFRLAGHDVEIDGPRFVPLDIVISVCVKSGYIRGEVKAVLLETFSLRLPDGRRGFFHPDNFSFGQSVFLSKLIAAAMKVPGVDWIDYGDEGGKPNRFGRRGGPSRTAEMRLDFDRLEIARLDNDPNYPEHGKIEFHMQGGL